MDLGSEMDRAGGSPYADTPAFLSTALLLAVLLVPICWLAARALH